MEDKWFILSKKQIIILMIYYVILIHLGAAGVILAITDTPLSEYLTLMMRALIGSIGISILGCCIFYSRKLYKKSINRGPIIQEDKNDLVNIGGFLYFFLRPLFSAGFSLLIILTIKSGIILTTTKHTTFEEGFVYFSMVLSFFAGFSSGDFLDLLEKKGKDILSNLNMKG